MRYRFPLIVVVALAVALAGCNATKLQRAEALERGYGASLIAINAALDLGAVKTPEQARVVRIAIQEANAAVADYTKYARDGADESDREYFQRRALDAINRLAAIAAELKGAK